MNIPSVDKSIPVFRFYLPGAALWVALVVFFFFPAPVGAGNLPQTGRVEVIEAASEYDYPPFCVLSDENQADGFSVELLRAALKAMGRDVSFRLGPWEEVKQSLAEGTVQVLPLVGRTPEREEVFDFTVPYLTMHGTILVREGETAIFSLADLAGKEVAVMRGDNAEEFARRTNLGATIVTTGNFEEALRGLAAGRHDAVLIQRLVALQLMKQTGLTHLKFAGPPLDDFVQSFCFAVRDGDRDLLSLLNEGLSIVMVDGTFRRLLTKWVAPIEDGAKGRSRIFVGGDSNYPPFEFLDENGEPAGFNVELSRAIARELGLEITFRLDSWGKIRQALEQDEIDVIQGMFYSPERENYFAFSPPHSIVNHAIVVREGTTMAGSLSELSGKSILVMKGDIMHDAAVALGYKEQLKIVETQEEALRLLSGGEYDCALVAKIPALYRIKQRGWTNLRLSDYSVHSPEYCFAVPKRNHQLLALFSEGLANVRATGEYRRIYAKWLGLYSKPDLSFQEVLKRSLWIVLPVLILLFGTLLWSWTLRVTVRRRTAELHREIADRKERETEIESKNAQLDDKNAELERFTYAVSHDLKSPLVTLKAFLGFFEGDLKTGDEERLKKDLYYMHNAADKMGRLLDDLLQMARVGKVPTTSVRLPFRVVVDEALAIVTGSLGAQGGTVQVADADVVLRGDKERLVAIWQNLLDNAIKYRQPEIPLVIQVGLDQTEGGPVFYVGDNGVGVEPRHHDMIFGLFTQLVPEMEGSGLGLALVKRIVEINEGRIWVESDGCNAGSRFRFTLPAAINQQGGA